MQCPVCTGRFAGALNLAGGCVKNIPSRLFPPQHHPLDAVGAAVLPVSTVDTARSCVSYSCMSQRMSASATPSCARTSTSCVVTWACQSWGNPQPQHSPTVPTLCHSPQWLLWVAGVLGPAAQTWHRSWVGLCHSISLSAEVFSSVPKVILPTTHHTNRAKEDNKQVRAGLERNRLVISSGSRFMLFSPDAISV